MASQSFIELTAAVREFVEQRDWDQFHTPKNLSMALSVEAAELVELFQWLTPEQSESLTPEQTQRAKEELGDIQIYLARIADKLGFDLIEVAQQKLEQNHLKYPADKVRGSAAKYTEYGDD